MFLEGPLNQASDRLLMIYEAAGVHVRVCGMRLRSLPTQSLSLSDIPRKPSSEIALEELNTSGSYARPASVTAITPYATAR